MRFVFTVVTACLSLVRAAAAGPVPTAEQSEFFEAKVRPLLESKCLACHGERVQMAGLKLTTAEGFFRSADTGPIVAEGSSEGSRLVQAVGYQGKIKMPPTGKLTDGEIAALEAKPIAGLLKDLKARGLLADTLVVWGGEFGRTPYAEADGRDHNPYGFTIWMAGGGVKGGMVYGATDEFGYHAIENRMHIHDLHATILHLLGLDHEKLTYRYDGRDFRLTDVHGVVARGILA